MENLNEHPFEKDAERLVSDDVLAALRNMYNAPHMTRLQAYYKISAVRAFKEGMTEPEKES